MTIADILRRTREAITDQRVFGDPIERDGMTVIPVAKVMGGGGGGGAWPTGAVGPASATVGAEEGSPDVAGRSGGDMEAGGSGAGFGLVAVPAGVYVVQGDEVRWIPAVDVNRLALAGMITTLLGLLILRSIARSIARR